MTEARNVFGEPLAECCTKPIIGFYRDGYLRHPKSAPVMNKTG